MKRRENEKIKKFDFRNTPRCIVQKKVDTPMGKIALCGKKKGVGRHNQYCKYNGSEALCPFYESKKWGRSLFDMAGDLIGHG